jgi:hypothetical protein
MTGYAAALGRFGKTATGTGRRAAMLRRFALIRDTSWSVSAVK